MKKNRLLLILLFIIIGIVAIAAAYEKYFHITPEEVIDQFKDIKSYTADVTYIVENVNGEIKYQSTQCFDENYGMRVDFNGERVHLYRGNQIEIRDLKNNKSYKVDKDHDELYRLAFLNEIAKYLVLDEEIKYYNKNINGVNCLVIELSTLSQNQNLAREIFVIDSEKRIPKEILVFDKSGNEKVKILYNNYNKANKLDEGLFK